MPKTTKQNKRNQKETKAILKTADTLTIQQPEHHEILCTICFKKINKDEHEILECGHMFHSSCLKQWKRTDLKKDLKNDLKKDSKTFEFHALRVAIKGRLLLFFKKDENIYNCLCCNMEYTRKFCSDGNVIIKRILATIHLKDGDNEVVYYITHWAELVLFVPLFEMLNNKLSKKWGLMLSLLKREWEDKNTDIYAMKITGTTDEFVFAIDSPLNKTTCTEIIHFKRVDIKELRELLNEE